MMPSWWELQWIEQLVRQRVVQWAVGSPAGSPMGNLWYHSKAPIYLKLFNKFIITIRRIVHYIQSWGNDSDAVLLTSFVPAKSIPLALWGDEKPFYMFFERFLSQSTNSVFSDELPALLSSVLLFSFNFLSKLVLCLLLFPKSRHQSKSSIEVSRLAFKNYMQCTSEFTIREGINVIEITNADGKSEKPFSGQCKLGKLIANYSALCRHHV